MDPKTLPANLDPKLKETYERIMGINNPAVISPAPPPAVSDSLSSIVTQTNSLPQTPAPPQTTQSTLPAFLNSTPSDNQPGLPSGIFGDSTSKSNVFVDLLPKAKSDGTNVFIASDAKNKDGNSMFSFAVILAGIVVFFVIYAFLWTRILHLKLPLIG